MNNNILMNSNMSEININQPSGLGSFTIGDLGVFIGTLGGVITSILIVLQKSHCRKIKLCCMECERHDPSEDDIPIPVKKKKVVAQPEPEPEPEPEEDEDEDDEDDE